MSKTKNWMVALALVSLLAIGVVALAGNGFGTSGAINAPIASGTCSCDQDDDGDGIVNSEDMDWVRPLDGSGCGEAVGYGQGLSTSRPLDGTGFGAQRGGGVHRGLGNTCVGR